MQSATRSAFSGCRYVLLQPRPVGAAQVLQFQRLLGGGLTLDTNSRTDQPMNGRDFDYEQGGMRAQRVPPSARTPPKSTNNAYAAEIDKVIAAMSTA